MKFARLTKSHIDENVAIMANGLVSSVSRITAEITGGRAIINRKFTEEEVGRLTKSIRMK